MLNPDTGSWIHGSDWPQQAAMTQSLFAGSVAGAPRRYAVVGAGFAGIAAAWHLMQQGSQVGPTEVHLWDVAGLAGGASGAAAGLLHPFSPTGKVCTP